MDNYQSVDELVAGEPEVVLAQRARSYDASLQAAAEALAQQRFLNITDNSTRRSAMHRWAMYTNYCKSVDCPPYPVSGALVGLAIYHLAEGNAEGGKAYDTHVSAINGVRKATCKIFVDQPDCGFADDNLMSYMPLRNFCRVARQSVTGKGDSPSGPAPMKRGPYKPRPNIKPPRPAPDPMVLPPLPDTIIAALASKSSPKPPITTASSSSTNSPKPTVSSSSSTKPSRLKPTATSSSSTKTVKVIKTTKVVNVPAPRPTEQTKKRKRASLPAKPSAGYPLIPTLADFPPLHKSTSVPSLATSPNRLYAESGKHYYSPPNRNGWAAPKARSISSFSGTQARTHSASEDSDLLSPEEKESLPPPQSDDIPVSFTRTFVGESSDEAEDDAGWPGGRKKLTSPRGRPIKRARFAVPLTAEDEEAIRAYHEEVYMEEEDEEDEQTLHAPVASTSAAVRRASRGGSSSEERRLARAEHRVKSELHEDVIVKGKGKGKEGSGKVGEYAKINGFISEDVIMPDEVEMPTITDVVGEVVSRLAKIAGWFKWR